MERRETTIGGPTKPLQERIDLESILGRFNKSQTRELIEKRLRFNRTKGISEKDKSLEKEEAKRRETALLGELGGGVTEALRSADPYSTAIADKLSRKTLQTGCCTRSQLDQDSDSRTKQGV